MRLRKQVAEVRPWVTSVLIVQGGQVRNDKMSEVHRADRCCITDGQVNSIGKEATAN